MEDEQALWEVATALGCEFDADATRTYAYAAAALEKLVPVPDDGAPYDREWHEGLSLATVKAAVTLLHEGTLTPYLTTGQHAEGAVDAMARLAPLPDPKDRILAEVLLQKLYDRRHAQR